MTASKVVSVVADYLQTISNNYSQALPSGAAEQCLVMEKSARYPACELSFTSAKVSLNVLPLRLLRPYVRTSLEMYGSAFLPGL